MEHDAGAVNRAVEDARVADVAFHLPDRQSVEVGDVAAGLHERPHLTARVEQRAHDG